VGSSYTVTFGERQTVGGLFEVLPSSDNAQYFWIGSSTGLLATWKTAKMMSVEGCLIGSLDGSNYLATMYTATNTGSDAIIRFRVGKVGTADKYLQIKYDDSPATLNFIPTDDNQWDLGASGNRWKTFYAYDGNFSDDVTISDKLTLDNLSMVSGGFLIRTSGTIKPVFLADGSAENDSIYYSTTQSKVVYKDQTGVVHNFY
jgi:hypothetical protein